MQVEGLDTAVVDYINEIKSNYEQQIHELKNNVIEYQHKYLEIKERYDLLVYKRFVRSAEQLLADEKQLPLFTTEPETAETPEEAEPEETTEVKSYSRKKPGRKPIDPNIPRIEKIIDIEETDKTCVCGANLTRIGEETSEKLHIIPPRIYVEKIIRLKYACRSCEGTESEGEEKAVRIAPVEPSIIPRSIATPSLLSCIFIQKFEDHLPYYRQEKQFERIGVTISRQDMSNWQQKAYQALQPLFGLLEETVKAGPVIQMDETMVQVMGEEGRLDTKRSYMWLARGGPPGKTVVWYEYQKTRGASHAKAFLSGYSGYLQTDGYEGYDAAIKDMPSIIHVGCFAHARRKFFEASKATKKPHSAEEGIKHIRKLYALESELQSKNLSDDEFLSERKARAGPILEQFKKWLFKRKEEVPPSLLLGKAIHYTLDQWDKMTAYLESPNLTPDNNACENAIRPFVLGRKNWLFCKSPEGAESSCGIYSLIETAKQNGLVPLQYLTALFKKAPLASLPEDWENLLPWNIFTA
jgi:transposase